MFLVHLISWLRGIGFLFAVSLLTSCTYLKYSAIQSDYARTQRDDPSQSNVRHLLDRGTFFVFGKTIDMSSKYGDTPLAVTAYSSRYKKDERVDTLFSAGSGTHYGLNLPEGNYILQVYADVNRDGVFSPPEVVGRQEILLSDSVYPEKVAGHIDIQLRDPAFAAQDISIALPTTVPVQPSLYYPTGTIRSLDDPLFDESIATLGVYDPASFLEQAPTMFYALEENVMHKMPVVFVHGIGGNPRAFEPIIQRLDRDRYAPWFFYYPSGGDLNQLADLFYRLFLSGTVIPLNKMPMIIVAHSMGGLVVREALNNYQGKATENRAELFVSIASPFGGHPAAAYGESSGVMKLPVWRDLKPDSQFIDQLYRQPLPEFVNHQLYYAYKNTRLLKLRENSDGVVPLSSQLYPQAQKQSGQTFGFNDSHVGILANEDMISRLLVEMGKVSNIFPETNLQILADGGLGVDLSHYYSPEFRYLIRYAGKYLVLLAHDMVKHPTQGSFVPAVQGKIPAKTDHERAFLRFMREYPDEVEQVIDSWKAGQIGSKAAELRN